MKYATRMKVAGLFMALASFPAMAGFISLFFGLKGMLIGVTLLAPLLGIYFARRAYEKGVDAKGRAAFEQFVKGKLTAPPEHLVYKRSSGIAVAENLVFLTTDDAQGVYPVSSLRNWRMSISETAAPNYANTQQALAQSGSNYVRLIEAWLSTGLLVDVKDTTNPSWQVRFNKEELPEARRWIEILNQAVNGDAPTRQAS